MPLRISITGVLGGGKTAVCNELEKLNLRIFSTGLMQREIAVAMGMTTLELNEYSETHPEIDQKIDSELCALSDSSENIVIDSRMAWHFVKNTFKVYLWADETVAAQRIMTHERGASEKYADIDQAKVALRNRKSSENYRFKEKYGVDCGNLSNYDLIIDTTYVLPEYIAKVILDHYKEHRSLAGKGPVFLVSPRCLYPTMLAGEASCLEEHSGSDEPVKLIYYGGCFYIYDEPFRSSGHSRVISLCKTHRPLIDCELAVYSSERITGEITGEDYIQKEYSLHKIRVWEELNGIKYAAYPAATHETTEVFYTY